MQNGRRFLCVYFSFSLCYNVLKGDEKMTTYFPASRNRLLVQYNLRLLVANLPPLAALITLAVLAHRFIGTVMPIKYYYAIAVIFLISVAYGFVTVLIGSAVMSERIRGHCDNTYIKICGDFLVLSVYEDSRTVDGENVDFISLWVLRFPDIEEIYLSGKKLTVSAPVRCFEERADWLEYDFDPENQLELGFKNNWYERNGGKMMNGVKIPDEFAYPLRVYRTIEHYTGRKKRADEHIKQFRQRMLTIAEQSEYFKKFRR